jgi:hypothetical protein
VTALAVQTVSAQNLFSTYSDFTGWGNAGSGSTVAPSSDWDYDGSTINGAGNSGNVGGSSPGGSLAITWAPSVTSFNVIAFSPGEAFNPAFMQAIDPGSVAAYQPPNYVAGNTVAYNGALQIIYAEPDNEGGNYFQVGVDLAYDANGYYSQFFPSSDTVLGYTSDNNAIHEVTIPYNIVGGSLTSLSMGIFYNSNYQPAVFPFYIDSISVVAVPEPSSLAFAALGGLCMFRVVRRRK